MENTHKRIVIVDALRGVALLGIMLIHSVEHFDFIRLPEYHFFFSAATDKTVFDTIQLLISGKAYSIFALLFGFSFFIQIHRQEEKGVDFRGRFLWRLTILLTIGMIHSLLYTGDILHIYALLGIVLVAVYTVKPKMLFVVAVVLALQLPLLCHLGYAFIHPDYVYVKTFGSGLGKIAKEIYANGSFCDVVGFNAWKGHLHCWAWTYYNGRYLQLIALFLIGLMLGKTRFFEKLSDYKKLSIRLLIFFGLSAFALYLLSLQLKGLEVTAAQGKLLKTVVRSYFDLAFTGLVFFTVIVLYQKNLINTVVRLLAYVGKMSLTNYILQAVIGVLLFYGFGLAWYLYLGSTWSLLYGFLFFALQIVFSKIWIKHFYYGPFEWLWRALTFFNFNLKCRRKNEL
jgi:uncharacterized protein